MYNVGTTFNIVDQSTIPEIQPTIAEQKEAVFLSLITSDKGPEEFMKVSGKDFYDYFGNNISFAKHGQPLLQAARIINNGGTLMVKRLVDDASTLGNAHITCTATADSSKKEVKLTFNSTSTENATDIATVYAAVNTDTLFTIIDIGRGVSNKSFAICPEYAYSKKLNYSKYSIKIMENYNTIETAMFNMNSSILENGNINTLNKVIENSKQVRGKFHEENFNTLLENIVKACYTANGYTDVTNLNNLEVAAHVATLKTKDVLFCTGSKSTEKLTLSIKNNTEAGGYTDVTIVLDKDGLVLNSDTGVALSNGTNGSFNEFGDAAYVTMAKNFLEGKVTDEIYDVDNYMIDVCVDANYPADVKTAIYDLAVFRKDFFFFRDIGTSSTLKDYDSISAHVADLDEDIYVSDCSLYYDVIDPYTKKQITVTYGYKLAELLVDHLINNRNKPVAGLLYGMVFDDAIKGTANYIPMRKPQNISGTVEIIDEREMMQDARINYAAYYDGSLTLDCQYTRNKIYSQLSFINNILITQQVIKAIRKECPKSRFSFLTGQDLERYSDAVNRVISKYADNFASISFEYTADATMIANKVYNASIKVQYKDFVQSEIFTIFALPNA